ncbi:CD48 antigen BCM1 surface antigen BLAST-1 HM48-1 MRC OX-45 surface antigen SLAM family member 2 [Collichthys lucidus]|uniref:CD48 antigen BCM1 surface antigen BLAST-1 HM48-1 MRC OX-45 surface antigen SLAM family member 2 n=1 Tax=Collichthys lucidus TaxID=240159 RepID=A0A4U5U6E6_COLLU|nr:CD48 antigen BCM1 surface antigen BLAST-1 HM48-1 MRC OX-45 surface antigen SLAM family member 2 [Collichthys lucidus]
MNKRIHSLTLYVRYDKVVESQVLLYCVQADEGQEVVEAREGATVTLNTTETSYMSNTQVVWTFGAKNPNARIANLKEREVTTDYDERFKNRLMLYGQTGALTITQLRASDSGVYMYQSIGANIISQQFYLTVYSPLHSLSISVNQCLINRSCSSLTLECFVENSRDLTLSWYRGRDILKKTSSPDLSTKLSLALEIDSKDGGGYSCVAENPVEEKVVRLHAKDTCQVRETSSWCKAEIMVRLVFLAVFGLALIVLVVDYIRLRRCSRLGS